MRAPSADSVAIIDPRTERDWRMFCIGGLSQGRVALTGHSDPGPVIHGKTPCATL